MYPSEQFLQAILDAVPEHLVILDEEANILGVNRSWRSFAQENGLGGAVWHRDNWNYLEVCERAAKLGDRKAMEVAQAIRDLISGRQCQFQIEYPCHSSNHHRWYLAHGSRFEYGGARWVVLTHVDITGRRQAEEQNSRLVTAIEQAREMIFITDTEGMIEYVNPAFQEISGFTRAEALGKNASLLQSGEQSREFFDEMWAALRLGERWQGRFLNAKKDGDPLIMDASIWPLSDELSDITGYVAVHQDVTETVRVEAQLQHALRMETVGQLAGGIVHDFNNMLTSINGYADFVLRRLTSSSPLHGDVEKILKSGKQAAALTRQLLAFSRHQAQRPNAMRLNDVVQETASLLRRTISETIEMKLELEPELSYAWANPGQIVQVTMNLVVNARDAMPEGGILTIATHNRSVQETRSSASGPIPPGTYVVLEVRDRGCGMDAQARRQIFDPFYTTKRIGQGTGLGLATVYGIVKQSRGYIDVESKPGEGTTFTVYLLRAEEIVTQAQPQPCADSLESPGATFDR